MLCCAGGAIRETGDGIRAGDPGRATAALGDGRRVRIPAQTEVDGQIGTNLPVVLDEGTNLPAGHIGNLAGALHVPRCVAQHIIGQVSAGIGTRAPACSTSSKPDQRLSRILPYSRPRADASGRCLR